MVGGGLAGLVTATLLARRGARCRCSKAPRASAAARRPRRRTASRSTSGRTRSTPRARPPACCASSASSPRARCPPSTGLFACVGGELHVLPAAPASLLRTTLFSFREKLQVGAPARRPAQDRPRRRGAAQPSAEWIASRRRASASGSCSAAWCGWRPTPTRRTSSTPPPRSTRSSSRSPPTCYYLDGGWQRCWCDGLERRAREAGAVDHHAGARRAAGRRATARVRRSCSTTARGSKRRRRGRRRSRHRAAPGGEGARARARRATIAALVPVRAACLDLALSRLPRPDRNFALGLDRPLYLSVHSATAALAPPGAAR